MKKYNRKYVSYSIYTKTLCRAIKRAFDYYGTAVDCMKKPEKYIANQKDIKAIKNGECVIRKVTQEWKD